MSGKDRLKEGEAMWRRDGFFFYICQ